MPKVPPIERAYHYHLTQITSPNVVHLLLVLQVIDAV